MTRLKTRSGRETLEIPIEVDGVETTYVIPSPSIEAFDAYRDMLNMAHAKARFDALGDAAPDDDLDVEAIKDRLLAYAETIPDGETIESMLIGPAQYRAMQTNGVDGIVRQHVAHTIVIWVSHRSTAKAADYWATGDSPGEARGPKRPQDRQRKKRKN